jgi:hypothetical protein
MQSLSYLEKLLSDTPLGVTGVTEQSQPGTEKTMFHKMYFSFDEPPERLEQRALAGIDHGLAAFRRLRRRLPAWIRKGDHIDAAKAIACLAAVEGALALISPCGMGRLARSIRRQMGEAR